MKRLGLYIHIPFCIQKCNYCDFCSLPGATEETVAAYIDRLCKTIASCGEACRAHTVDTVYFGGGTPTLLPPAKLLRVLETVEAHYRLDASAEITAECNPATATREAFLAMRAGGFNRISMGVQSVHAEELAALGRVHGFENVKRTRDDLCSAGFENVSMDLMQGIPKQTKKSYLESLSAVLSLAPTHLSAYGLSVEEGTPFGRMGDKLILPDEEESREMYFAGIELLAAHGVEQYEISNFARRGYESRHNLKYWRCEEYLGFGPAAYSCFGGERFGNSRDVRAFIEGKDILCERERIDASDAREEYVMLGLRLSEGISRSVYREKFGRDLDADYGAALCRYLPTGHVARTEDGYRLTPLGMYVSNAILSDVLTLAEN